MIHYKPKPGESIAHAAKSIHKLAKKMGECVEATLHGIAVVALPSDVSVAPILDGYWKTGRAHLPRGEISRSLEVVRWGEHKIEMLTAALGEARAHARVLAHAYEHDSSPPPAVVEESLAYPVTPAHGQGLVRPVLMWFASQMERKLRENDHKGGWSACTMRYLLLRMKNESAELAGAIRRARQRAVNDDYWNVDDVRTIIREAADVANFAMIVADNARAASGMPDSRFEESDDA
jgi:hypothetical protein